MQSYTSADYAQFLIGSILLKQNESALHFLIQESIDRGMFNYDDIYTYISNVDLESVYFSSCIQRGLHRMVLFTFDWLSDDAIQCFFEKIDPYIRELMEEVNDFGSLYKPTYENLLKKLLDRFDLSLINPQVIFYCGDSNTIISAIDIQGLQYIHIDVLIHSGKCDQDSLIDELVSNKIQEHVDSNQSVVELFRHFETRSSKSYHTLVTCMAELVNDCDVLIDLLCKIGHYIWSDYLRTNNSIIKQDMISIFENICEINGGTLLNRCAFADNESIKIILIANMFINAWPYRKYRQECYKGAKKCMKKAFIKLLKTILPSCLSDHCQQYIDVDMEEYLTKKNVKFDWKNVSVKFRNIDTILDQLDNEHGQSDTD